MFRRKFVWPAIILVASLQSAALAWMVHDRLSLIAHGRELVLSVAPVDPRSLFRGDYVILNLDVATVTSAALPDSLRRNDVVYVRLQKKAGGNWGKPMLELAHPGRLPDDQAVLRGRVKYIWRNTKTGTATVRLRYGLESYFVPEGTGKALETHVQKRQIRAIVAVGEDGEAAIKGLEIAGLRHLDPSLF